MDEQSRVYEGDEDGDERKGKGKCNDGEGDPERSEAVRGSWGREY